MATSSGAELPRSLEFLFSRNRLKRGGVAGAVPCCARVQPELLHVRCRSAEHMRLVNALCRLVEVAADDDAKIATRQCGSRDRHSANGPSAVGRSGSREDLFEAPDETEPGAGLPLTTRAKEPDEQHQTP